MQPPPAACPVIQGYVFYPGLAPGKGEERYRRSLLEGGGDPNDSRPLADLIASCEDRNGEWECSCQGVTATYGTPSASSGNVTGRFVQLGGAAARGPERHAHSEHVQVRM